MKVNILHMPNTSAQMTLENATTKTKKVAVLGASGYAGLELLEILESNPYLKVRWAGAHSEAGRPVQALAPQRAPLQLEPLESCPLDEVEAVLLGLPHGRSQEWVARAYAAGCTVVDLSADYRLNSQATYEKVYEVPPHAPRVVARGRLRSYRDSSRQD